MKSYYCEGKSGVLAESPHLLAEVKLPPGQYLVFAKGDVSLPRETAPKTAYYGVELLVTDPTAKPGSVDELKARDAFSQSYEIESTGSPVVESFALQAWVKSSAGSIVSLKIIWGGGPKSVYVSSPRISAIGVDGLEVVNAEPLPPPPAPFESYDEMVARLAWEADEKAKAAEEAYAAENAKEKEEETAGGTGPSIGGSTG